MTMACGGLECICLCARGDGDGFRRLSFLSMGEQEPGSLSALFESLSSPSCYESHNRPHDCYSMVMRCSPVGATSIGVECADCGAHALNEAFSAKGALPRSPCCGAGGAFLRVPRTEPTLRSHEPHESLAIAIHTQTHRSV